MFWTAEIEIYRLARSNGPQDENQNGVKAKNGNEGGRLGRYKKSQLSRKKCSEQLRSWKIYWWAQKFLRGHKILQKGHHNFGFWDRADVIFPTPKFWWFGALNGLKTSNFVLQTQFLSKIWSKLMSPSYFQFLYFFVFSHFCIFTIFDQIKKFNKLIQFINSCPRKKHFLSQKIIFLSE